jgi:arginyl-tRNA synthetase
MKPIIDILEQRIASAMTDLAARPAPAIVKPAQTTKFGDYQANGVMALAKQLKQNPRRLAEQIVGQLDLSDMCQPPEIAGPGFINLRLRPDWLANRLKEAIQDKTRLGVDPLENPPTTVIDFSSPNIAKQMHVGHLRSTIIGDVIARVLQFYYDDPSKIIRQNHIGDWGLQMGTLDYQIERKLKEKGDLAGDDLSIDDLTIDDLEKAYKDGSDLVAGDPAIAEICRGKTIRLQSGSAREKKRWEKVREISLIACMKIYEQLGVALGPENVCGESFYADKLPSVISVLSGTGLLTESEGAQCVFLDGFTTKEGDPLPLIVQKSDGAYLYATTDLAAVRYRVGELKAERIIYVTDARQKLHFEMFFTCACKAGWAGENVSLEHVPFGSVLGDNNRPLKTRSGENIKLKDLLEEAEKRARQIVEEKNPDLDEQQKQKIAHAVGIGAVKYADLSNNLVSDYVFNWDKMLSMDGNTAPYMQYAYARVQSIFRKGSIDKDKLLAGCGDMELTEPDELTLAKLLLRYAEVVETVAGDLRPHLLTNYLFDLAQAFSGFYTNCPVLKADDPARSNRLLLCYQTAQTIKHGLDLLGIETIDQM